MAYKTGNPVGSTDPRDLFDNAGILDQFANGPAPFYPDRFAVQRLSLSGMRYNFDQSITGWNAAFQQFLAGSGFEAPVSYAEGVTLERVTQTFVRDNVQYRIKDPADLPYTLTGDWDIESDYFASMGDSGLRQDLITRGVGIVSGAGRSLKSIEELRQLPAEEVNFSAFVLGYYSPLDGGGGEYFLDLEDTTSVDDGGSVIVGNSGLRWKLRFSNLDIRQFGAQPGTDAADSINSAARALYEKGGGILEIKSSYTASKKVNLYPYVHIRGGGLGKGSRLAATFSGVLFDTIKPAGYAPPLCYSPEVSGLTIVGRGVGQGVAFNITDCGYAKIRGNEIANFGVAFDWNRGSTATDLKESYFNDISQNLIKPCGIGHRFAGAANRNCISTNSLSDCLVAYDFSSPFNYSETNTFLNENIEGCHSWAEWSESVFSQTWIGICIENPASNGFVCAVKDPGRQVFLNLSLIPLGNSAAISMYSLFPGKASMVLGSAASSGDERLGVILPEKLVLKNILEHDSFHGSSVFSGTVSANSFSSLNVTLTGARVNDRIEVFGLRDLGGCTLQAFVSADDLVRVNVINGTGSNISLSGVEVSCIAKRCG